MHPRRIEGQADVKLITFEGNGKHFSFGASVEEHQKDMAPAMLRSFHALFFTIRDLSIPTLARISGQCLGGGMELPSCATSFSRTKARAGQPETCPACSRPGIARSCRRRSVGPAPRTSCSLGRTIDAQEAHAIGLVNAVVADRAALEAHVGSFIVARSRRRAHPLALRGEGSTREIQPRAREFCPRWNSSM
ncbi:MAG: hypothetical protein IPP83_11185 [Flavobacteriales bacterium]|nr:hypothetical protein [Flavobacteriales bacterium]